MTDKELRKLSRAELLSLLIEVTEENERLSAILSRRGEQAQTEGAAATADGVTEDVQGVFNSLESTAVGFLKEARDISDQIILEAQERADQMIAQAKEQAAQIAGGPVSDTQETVFSVPEIAGAETTVPFEDEPATAGQTDAVLEAVGEVRPPDPDAMKLPWREHGAEAAETAEEVAEVAETEEEAAEAAVEEAAEAEAEEAAEAEAEEVAEAEAEEVAEAVVEEAAEVVEEATESEDISESVQAKTEEAPEVEVPAVSEDIREVNVPDEFNVTVTQILEGTDESKEEEAAAPPAETAKEEETFELPWLRGKKEEEQVEAPEPTAGTEPAQKKPLTAIDMLRMMQQGGGK